MAKTSKKTKIDPAQGELPKWEQVGVIGVDAGLCWIGDPSYCVTPDATEHPAKNWNEFCDIIKDKDVHAFPYKKGHPGLGVVVSTGYGDGVYPVFVRRNAEGRIAEVRVRFV